jgi:hypothetical protein
MFVPSLRGILSPEIGLTNYQHPQRTNQDYNEDLDNFSALVIYTSLLALATHPDLWQQHHTGENLIFSANDYKAPQQSVLLQQLKRSTNPDVQKLAAQVEQCCIGAMAQVPKLEVVIAAQNVQQRLVTATPAPQPDTIDEEMPEVIRLPLQLESLLFYESESSIMPYKEKRRYSTYFPQSIARYIYFEINLDNQMWKRGDRTYHFEWRFYDQNGDLIRQGQRDFVIKNEWKSCWYSASWGTPLPGNWTPGTYRVEILIDGVEFAQDVFIITHSQVGWNRYLEFESALITAPATLCPLSLSHGSPRRTEGGRWYRNRVQYRGKQGARLLPEKSLGCSCPI